MPIGSLWLPVLVSAVSVFVVSSIVHMALKYHKADMRALPGEEGVREALARANPSPGLYFTPYCAGHAQMKDPSVKAKFEKGPVAILTILPRGLPMMPKLLIQWFAFCLGVSFISAYVARITLHAGDTGMIVMRVTGTVAFAAYGFANISDSIWKGQPWGNTARALLDGVLYSVTTAVVFRGLWPAVT